MAQSVKLGTTPVDPGLNAVPLAFQVFLFQHDERGHVVAVEAAGNAELVQAVAEGVKPVQGSVDQLLCIHGGFRNKLRRW